MAFFNRNPNEEAYIGGKKHWTDVIKNSASGELLIWRQPEEDFNTNSTLVVMPGEKAVFIMGGVVEQVFEKGTYKLSTENYPFISRLRNALSGGISTFHCVVYFVRDAESREILWGTDSPISVRDKVFNIVTDVRVRGAYKLKIENPALFLEKQVGNNVFFQEQEEINLYFENILRGKIKSAVAKFLNGLQQDLIGIDVYLDELSEQITPYIEAILAEYGLKCTAFVLSGMDVDKSKYDAIDVSQISAIEKINQARGDKAVMDVLGNDWGRQKAADILGNLSNNPGAGGMAAAGAGMGMGMAAGGVFNSMAQEMFAPMKNQTQQQPIHQAPSGRFTQKNTGISQGIKCVNCGSECASGAKFCSNCGAPLNQKVFCANCGTELEPGMKFCSNCGEKRKI